MKRDFLTLSSFTKDEILAAIGRALEFKKLVKSGKCPQVLKNKTLAMIFEKESTRTRVSFEVGMHHMGGQALYLNQSISQIGRGESYADTARVLSRYVNVILFRTFSQKNLQEIAAHATVPVINGLTDAFHPCQLLADLMTLMEKGLDLKKMTVSYVGDGNNMAHSWMEAAKILNFTLRVATPQEFPVNTEVKKNHTGKNILYTHDAPEAVRGCDAVNTDTWFSMGQEVSEEKRKKFWPFQINAKLLSQAKPKALVLHCLPAHRGEEITDEVMDGPQSVVFDQAENRLYAQMAILERLLCPPPSP